VTRRALAIIVLAAAACRGPAERAGAPQPRTPGVRTSMGALHAMGGVPPGWKLTPPAGDVAAGRALFVDFGCPSCHRVEGEPFSAKPGAGVGPDLTGMGAHHPPGYFAEAIMNPDAVLIEGPGYIGPDGHSVMPDYPEMTIQQLADVVAYLASLKTGGAHAGHVMPPPAIAAELPAPAPTVAKAYFAQSYDVLPGQLQPFEKWWREEGARRFLAIDGLLAVDTYVDYARADKRYTSIFAFRDAAALDAFVNDPSTEPLGLAFDRFIGDHGHTMHVWPPVYRVPSLSAP
jgi:mono/diheme cytochrome c family protein